MVIGFTPENGHCAVDLLDGHYSYHLVGEGHLRKRQFAVGALIDRVAKTVGSTNDERQVFARRHLLLEVIGELNRAELAAVFVQQNDIHGGREGLQNEVSFGCLDLIFGQGLGVLEIRQHDDLKRHIVPQALLVFIDEGTQTRVTRLPCK